MNPMWKKAFPCPNYQKGAKNLKLKKLMKSVLKSLLVVMVVSVVAAALPSCKSQEDCGAYQGSGKSTRSHSHSKHR